MSADRLADNVTIADLTASNTLDDPVEYVRQVFGNMIDCRRQWGTAFVRIGTTGRGIAPNYRVAPEAPETPGLDTGEGVQAAIEEIEALSKSIDRHGQYAAFHGRSHRQLQWGTKELREEHWSAARMSHDEVQTLLGSLRGFKRRQAASPPS